MDPNGIFPNNELDLQKIKVYGFDFGEKFKGIVQEMFSVFYVDRLYLIARYKPALHTLIYDHAKTLLVKNLRVRLNLLELVEKKR